MKRIPKYLLHKATGQARVRFDGKSYYLGEYCSDRSKTKYDRLIAKWLTGDRLTSPDVLTVSRLCVKYVEEHAKQYYRKNGRQTSEVCAIPRKSKTIGLMEPGTTNKYRHPLPSLQKDQRQWVDQRVREFDE